MCQVNVKCPKCGSVNRNLYLDETEGMFECETCGSVAVVPGFKNKNYIICPKCECMSFDYRTSDEGNWIAVCKDCGHELELYPYYDGETGRILSLPVYDMQDIPRLLRAERRLAV